jgi:hypothetical protein
MESHDRRLQTRGLSFGDLNARIARLAIGLGVSLESEADIAHVIQQQRAATPVGHERRTSEGSFDASRLGSNPDRRVANKMEELRGLLVLRYGLESQLVDDIGVAATQKILSDSEKQLEREGFKPGADGIDLKRLFKNSEG